jgi:hypothetical protein
MMEEMIAADANWKETTLGAMMLEKFTEGLSGSEANSWQTDITSKIG